MTAAYLLPETISVVGVDYPIRTDFRAILDILCAMNDPELTNQGKAEVTIRILFPEWKKIPAERMQETLEKAIAFIDCGNEDDGKPHPKLIDWEQDAHILVPAINSVAHTEIRALKYLHWWTFMGYYMDIRESLFSEVLNIRLKKAKHKKLDKAEQEFYKNNKTLVDLKSPESEEVRQEKENILKFL